MGPLPPHPKDRVLANMTNTRPPQAVTVSVNASVIKNPVVETPTTTSLPIPTSAMDTPRVEIDKSALKPSGPTEPNITSATGCPPGTTSVPNDCAPDSGPYTSTPEDVFDVDMDDSEPLAASPRVAMDHLACEIITDNDSTMAVLTNGQTGMDIGMLPRLGTHSLIETESPTLLFKDEDVRPDWLISAVKGFLRYTPYYGCLAKVVDQFLLQEARLGYPRLVMCICFFPCYLILTSPSPCD